MNSGAQWVRSSLHELKVLSGARCVDIHAVPYIEFAIRWAPFGRARPGDVLVAFGTDRRRFEELVRAGLQPSQMDTEKSRCFKRSLLETLTSAWQSGRLPSAVST